MHAFVDEPFRKLLVNFEKTGASYIGLLSLATAIICRRKVIFVCGLLQ
jgi:hypothetical protein